MPPCSDASRDGFAVRFAALPLTRPPPAEGSYYAIKAQILVLSFSEPGPR